MGIRWTTPAVGATVAAAATFAGLVGPMLAQEPRMDVFVESRDHPAIGYSTRPSHDPIAELDRKLRAGGAQLAFDKQVGYLRSTLEALRVPISSQTLVLSQTSQQAEMISPKNPRAIYFNGNVAVAVVYAALRSIDRKGQAVRIVDVMEEARSRISAQARAA